MTNTPVKQAVAYFKKGDYQQAKTYYEKAAQLHGSKLFEGSIHLCNLRLGLSKYQVPEIEIDEQLAKTQLLLEQSYQNYQMVKFQLMDQK